CQQYNNYPLSF
nr:immunoglobulin light chain junction region [Macaca mulatta]MOV65194.1 immunoglobulin light chain junction region [Macaca mulatta]